VARSQLTVAEEEETVEMLEGETLEDMKARLRPKKSSISPEMLDTANSYDDKVASDAHVDCGGLQACRWCNEQLG
jgi:hypothetical protein